MLTAVVKCWTAQLINGIKNLGALQTCLLSNCHVQPALDTPSTSEKERH